MTAVNSPHQIRIAQMLDKQPLIDVMKASWGSHKLMVGIGMYDVTELDALGLWNGEGKLLAAASWTMRANTAYLCALHSFQEGHGWANHILLATLEMAKKAGAVRIRAMLTNDNMPGMVLYQKHGFRFATIYSGAIAAYRSAMPTMITHGYKEIAIHDVLELELMI